MNIYPAIDIFNGQVVRLEKGDFSKSVLYSLQPEQFALKWQTEGAQWLHIVDLEGAKEGFLKNLASLKKIRKAVQCRIQFGGGLRNLGDIELLLELGINRVILGTKATEDSFLAMSTEQFGDQIAVSLDVRNGIVQTQGWLTDTQLPVDKAIKIFEEMSVQTVIYTNIQKDGILQGPDWEGLRSILQKSKMRIILSGGISQLSDVEKCSKIEAPNFEGVIIGKALYENKLNLQEAIQNFSSSKMSGGNRL